MKTPKRTMTKDHVEIERYIRGVNCQFNAMKSRWTRKNREARLKNAIREKVWQIELKKAQMRGYMRACVTLRSLLNKEMRLAATYEKAVSASGTFGQDIEGS